MELSARRCTPPSANQPLHWLQGLPPCLLARLEELRNQTSCSPQTRDRHIQIEKFTHYHGAKVLILVVDKILNVNKPNLGMAARLRHRPYAKSCVLVIQRTWTHQPVLLNTGRWCVLGP